MRNDPAADAVREAQQAEIEARRARIHAEHAAHRAKILEAQKEWNDETIAHRKRVEELLQEIAGYLKSMHIRTIGRKRS